MPSFLSVSPKTLLFLILFSFFLFFFFKTVLPRIRYYSSSYFKVTRKRYSKCKKDQGSFGEYSLFKSIKSLEDEGVKFLFNVYIPTTPGHATEIDILAISDKGIVSIENKNYSGTIMGGSDEKEWAEVLKGGSIFKNKNVFKFYNPILQNDAHIKAVRRITGGDIKSLIVFSDKCRLRCFKGFDKKLVINKKNAKKVLSEMLLTGNTVIDPDAVYEAFLPFTNADKDTKKNHIRNVSAMER